MRKIDLAEFMDSHENMEVNKKCPLVEYTLATGSWYYNSQ